MTLASSFTDIDPVGAAWQHRTYDDLWSDLQRRRQPGRRLVIAIDGRSGSGKTTFAAGLAARDSRATVVHTDDIAWHHSFFGWGYLLIDKLLEPFHDGQSPIRHTPDAWMRRGRTDAITIPAHTSTLIVEGVGVAARDIRRLLDVVVWVHASDQVGRRRVLARGGCTPEFVDDWTFEEDAFITEHRPWEIADVWINGEDGNPGPNRWATGVLASPGPRFRVPGSATICARADDVWKASSRTTTLPDWYAARNR